MEKKQAGRNQSLSVEQDFLEAYQRYVINKGINEKTAKWFAGWVKQLARYLKDVQTLNQWRYAGNRLSQ